MRKRFIKFKVSRIIPSFQSCRSKGPSSLPSNPVPSFSTFAPATANAVAALRLNHHPPPSSSKHHQSSIKRHMFSALLLARRSFLPSRSPRVPSRTESESAEWHVLNKLTDYNNYQFTPPRPKIYTSAATSDDLHHDDVNQNDVILFPPLNLKNRTRRLNRRRRRNRTFQKFRISTSSDNNDVIFSDNDDIIERDKESDTLVSTDDSASHRRPRKTSTGDESPTTVPARLSEFMRSMVTCEAVEGKVRESFAVVKRSEEPYEDFKRSMAEMVVEKELYDTVELEELLRCYLSLNSVHHHDAIVRAFSEIWEVMFSKIA